MRRVVELILQSARGRVAGSASAFGDSVATLRSRGGVRRRPLGAEVRARRGLREWPGAGL